MDAKKKHEKALRRKQKLAERKADGHEAPQRDAPKVPPNVSSPQNQAGMNAARDQVKITDRPGSMFRRKV